MKSFAQATNPLPPAEAHSAPLSPLKFPENPAESCAALLLETAPLIMGTVRRLISTDGSSSPLTIQQFRTLVYLQRHQKASLSETAEFLDLALPSTSKLVDQLVKHGFLTRDNDAVDRRRMILRMTPTGEALLSEAQAEIRRRLADALGALDGGQLVALGHALVQMRHSLATSPERIRKAHREIEAAK